ncbi:DUF202 domain-containing protein [Arthrobacter sp. I2-34]|uniref:DUF202 domain-containing protein n=1 Tax=Arthrobacter hankyongi TaxID=2904801 RepID=A0ABS9L2W8_9MICC|nr:DUF202 domain-containing protein [Arthrobacter hankyongi]MCG2620980.1 DUF202 domain-containing protein [Arthrobacter hankyongi]
MGNGTVPEHHDAGLQPERTTLAWGRTMLSMVVAAAIFLRWTPHHGWFTGILVGATLCAALAINLTQKRRHHRAVRGIAAETVHADAAAVLWTSASVVLLGALGIYAVLFLPLDG